MGATRTIRGWIKGLDSRLRGNDGGARGNDGGARGNDSEARGNDAEKRGDGGAAGLSDILSPTGIVEAEYGLDPLATPSLATSAAIPEPATPIDNRQSKIENRPSPQSLVPSTSVVGAPGTPIFYGFVRDLGEYNSKFEGREAFRHYEEMRRSDADVAAALAACKLPIRAADWQVLPGVSADQPGYARAVEIARFVRENLFGGLESPTLSGGWATQTFESVIENALLCLDFGCAAHEDLWHVDGGAVRLRRLSARLPLTFYRFHVEPDGETLIALEQWGYRGNAFVNVRVPADKLALFVVNREGANFFGRSLLRPAYQHWFTKSHLYRIDAISCERNGMGVPWIEQGPNASPADVKAARDWATKLSIQENLGVSLPPGWQLHLEGVRGSVRDPGPSIRHHSEMIARSVLAMFMSLGTAETGSRALGNVLTDFFYLSLEATARMIAAAITETSIRRLVDFNFEDPGSRIQDSGTAGQRPESRILNPKSYYPRLVCSNIAVLNPLETLGVLKDVAAANVDLLQPDDETENYFRKKLGLPAKAAPGGRTRYALIQERVLLPGGVSRESGIGSGELGAGKPEGEGQS